MKLENQVCSLEQAKKLNNLGVFQVSLYYHWYTEIETRLGLDHTLFIKPHGELSNSYNTEYYSAFNVAELGVLLGDWCCQLKRNSHESSFVGYYKNDEVFILGGEVTEAEARAGFLIWLLQNKIITKDACNKQLTTS